jgi:hypothetical protein
MQIGGCRGRRCHEQRGNRRVRGAQNFIAYVTFAVLGTLAAIALLDFLIRPATVGRLPQSFGSIPHPVRAVQRRVARGRRYASIISAVRRHGLVSTLSRRNPAATIGHVHARERRLGVQLSQVLQEAGWPPREQARQAPRPRRDRQT